MITSVIFDIDKVLVTNPNSYEYSELFSKKYSVDPNEFLDFIKTDYKQAKIGKCDLEKSLVQKLAAWEVNIPTKEIFEEWYTPSELIVNKELLNKLDANSKYKYYIASNNEKYRGELLWEQLGLCNHFDDKFFSYEIGVTKDNPKFFEAVCARLKINPVDLLFIDDKEKNIKSANSVEINTILYKNNENLLKSIQKFLPDFK